MTSAQGIRFILNDQVIGSDLTPGTVALDFLRHDQKLTGTKEGCREGDCGACMILLGELKDETVRYQPVNSCLLILAELAGKHVVTIEGLNGSDLNPIQQAIVDEGATQCGFCTPGMVVAITGFFLNNFPTYEEAVAALDGNICRCTGYKSIERAVMRVRQAFSFLKGTIATSSGEHLEQLVNSRILPDYFLQIPLRLQHLQPVSEKKAEDHTAPTIAIAGGTDLLVQKPEKLLQSNLELLSGHHELRGICIEGKRCHIGATTTIQEMIDSPIMRKLFPRIHEYFKFVSSTPIRSRATVGGNIVNASPIGDLTIFFLALDATVSLKSQNGQRELPLRSFFKGYKQLERNENELVQWISFPISPENSRFNFEKVSRRANLDIASVNSAIQVHLENGLIQKVHLSAGGVSPVPLYLSRTVDFLIGKEISTNVIQKAAAVAVSEISPISDVRGSAHYKRLLLRQLIYAHFIALFPQQIDAEVLR
jgi:xanthine dehydrogenase small subunit